MTKAPILIMAGGTGGHVFPALAVARELMKRDRQVVWLGTHKGLENRLVPEAGIPLDYIRVSGLRRKGLLSWMLAPFKVAIAVWDAAQGVRKRRPGMVLGMGGFASGPGGFAAWLLRRPLVIHEQNAAAGLTNRLLAGLAREVLQAFPGSFSSRITARTIGNPVRQEIFSLPDPQERMAGRSGPLRLLVLGGSQGALALNQVVPAAVALLPDDAQIEIWHQSGAATLEIALDAYHAQQVEARVDAFIDDMNEAYAWADMVVCRSGALTISELAAAGLGAVLVPYPSAVDDHQTLNAQFLVDAEAAVLVQQEDLTPEALSKELLRCISERALVIDRAMQAYSLAQPSATDELADICLEWEAA
ncbi:MAG: undecaprenyldiphospho-muramoylpentapeptide beta-N-acetylglucosaminyltransferase [Gammaproteobacteria bacterium]|nr:undecaprenyldiphospho-muramoylpentapeptide beta-N-acetylglucosaminyltransferase [Gammaproteobacteria bacterium]